jgi:hypothetical protein
MPLDPRIAMGFQSPQFESPVNMMGNMMKLKSMQQQNALAEQQMGDLAAERARTALLNKVYGESVSPEGVLDYGKLRRGLAQGGQGALLPGVNEQEYKEGEARSKRGKADLELFGQGLQARRELLNPNMTPDAYLAWHEGNHKDPIVGPKLTEMGINAADSRAEIMARIQRGELPQLIAESAMGVQKLYDAVRPVETVEGIEMMTPTGTTLAKRKAPPKTPGAVINMGPAETEFSKTIAGDAAKNLGEMQKGARSANSSYSNIERLTPLLNSEAFISGTLGNTRLSIAKALGLEGAEETQTFFSQMGRETAETIKSFGAGTGLSDNDRIYAEKIAGGNVDLTPGAIKRILFLRQQANRAAIIQYNDERRVAAASNPKSNLDQYYRDIPVPPPPSYNYKGWRLETDAQGNSAYVSPDRKSFQETR